MKKNQIVVGMLSLMLCGSTLCLAQADSSATDSTQTSQVETEHLAPQVDVLSAIEGMEPVTPNMLENGLYPISAASSSSMFTIEDCVLMVEDGTMEAVLTMSGKGYLCLYMGTGEEAVAASEESYIPYVEDAQGNHTFTVPVEALDQAVDCAAYSKKKEKWYDRTLVFSSTDLPDEAFAEGVLKTIDSLKLADGTYQIDVTLGSEKGQASVESPALLLVEDGVATAQISFQSGKYDYVVVNSETYEALENSERPTFEIPVTTLDRKVPILADSTVMIPAMEIAYTLTFDSASIKTVE